MFFFFKARECSKKNHNTLRHLTQQFGKVRAAINLSVTGFGLVRCPRLRAGTGLSRSRTRQPHRESWVLFAGWARAPHGSHCARHGTAARRRRALARSPRTTGPLQNHAAGRAFAPAPDPSLRSSPSHKTLCKQEENLLLTALQHLNGLKRVIYTCHNTALSLSVARSRAPPGHQRELPSCIRAPFSAGSCSLFHPEKNKPLKP